MQTRNRTKFIGLVQGSYESNNDGIRSTRSIKNKYSSIEQRIDCKYLCVQNIELNFKYG